jgi:hypothetical protein
MALRHFTLPRGGEFSIPADWWAEAGMEGFACGLSATYRVTPLPEILLVPVEAIEPLSMESRNHLSYGGFDHERMVRVLQGFSTGAAIPPIQVAAQPPQRAYRYRLHHGAHRFFGSVAAGFSHVPAELVVR